jgi:hypothetical protein
MSTSIRFALLALVLASASLVHAQSSTSVRVLEVRPNITCCLALGQHHGADREARRAACRYAVLALAPQTLAEIRKLSQLPVRYVINTNSDPITPAATQRSARRVRVVEDPTGRIARSASAPRRG